MPFVSPLFLIYEKNTIFSNKEGKYLVCLQIQVFQQSDSANQCFYKDQQNIETFWKQNKQKTQTPPNKEVYLQSSDEKTLKFCCGSAI